MPTLTDALEDSIHRAIGYAEERHHELATLEHLLLALLDDPDAVGALIAVGANIVELREALSHFINSELDPLKADDAEQSAPSTGFQRAIQRAAIHVQSSNKEEVTGANVLVAIFNERESHAAFYLQEQDITRYDVVNFLEHGIATDEDWRSKLVELRISPSEQTPMQPAEAAELRPIIKEVISSRILDNSASVAFFFEVHAGLSPSGNRPRHRYEAKQPQRKKVQARALGVIGAISASVHQGIGST